MHHGPKRHVVVNRSHQGKDVNGFGMLNGDKFALFLGNGGVVGLHGGEMKNWRFCSYGNFGDKNHRFHLPAEHSSFGSTRGVHFSRPRNAPLSTFRRFNISDESEQPISVCRLHSYNNV